LNHYFFYACKDCIITILYNSFSFCVTIIHIHLLGYQSDPLKKTGRSFQFYHLSGTLVKFLVSRSRRRFFRQCLVTMRGTCQNNRINGRLRAAPLSFSSAPTRAIMCERVLCTMTIGTIYLFLRAPAGDHLFADSHLDRRACLCHPLRAGGCIDALAVCEI
jgi:hypothetical protein